MKCGVETVGRKAGFLLDRMRRRPRPRNRQTRKSLCPARIEGNEMDLRANGSGRIDNEVGQVTGGASSTATRGYDEPRHLHRVDPIGARSARRAAPCSTIASDSPRPGRRPHQRRRSAPSSNSSDEDGGRAIRE